MLTWRKTPLRKEKNVKSGSVAVSWHQNGNDCTNWWSVSLECLDSHSLQVTVMVIRVLCLRASRLFAVLMRVLDPLKRVLDIFIMSSQGDERKKFQRKRREWKWFTHRCFSCCCAKLCVWGYNACLQQKSHFSHNVITTSVIEWLVL